MKNQMESLKTKPWIENLKPYQAGKSIEEIKKQYGLSRVVKLGSNENPYGPSPKVLAALTENVSGVALYPDGTIQELRECIAAHHTLLPSQVVCTNGSDEALLLLALAFLDHNDVIRVFSHTFSQYECVARIAGASVEVVAQNPHEPIHAQNLLKNSSNNLKMVFLCTPNNPTGSYLPKPALEQFLQTVPPHVWVVIDEAYGEFATKSDYVPAHSYLSRYPNLIVLHTFSKVYGLAGLRVGYALASEVAIAGMEKVRNFNVFNSNVLAQKAALVAMQDTAYTKWVIQENQKERAKLTSAFKERGYTVTASEGNFICVEMGEAAESWYLRLLSQGCITRYLKSFGLPGWVRITVGTPVENDFLISLI